MYGENMRKWLDSEKPETYDFRDEIVGFKGRDTINRFFIYKALDIAKKPPNYLGSEDARSCVKSETSGESAGYERGREADNCSLIQAVYWYLWEERYLAYCRKDSGLLTGETMNSCFTTIAEYLKPSINKFQMSADCRKARWGNQKLFCLYYDNKELATELLEPAREFLKSAYTIGNFIPVPKGCNDPRGKGPTQDYWDLALFAVYKWYAEKDSAGLEDMLQNQDGKVALYVNWLIAFGSWDRFVIANYMQDFVNPAGATDKGIFGCPKELWEGHFKGKTLPSEKQCEEFFRNADKLIRARSRRMIYALQATEDTQ